MWLPRIRFGKVVVLDFEKYSLRMGFRKRASDVQMLRLHAALRLENQVVVRAENTRKSAMAINRVHQVNQTQHIIKQVIPAKEASPTSLSLAHHRLLGTTNRMPREILR